ncbi:MAG TPA: hypothetical protein VK843_05390 [Planctomycetota bacterium]|nr:hypothetical protein [Planctomycetota bacterium]
MARDPSKPVEPEDTLPSEGAARKPFLLRLSPDLFEALRGWSAQEMRSVNGQIEYLLRRAVEERRRAGRKS